MDGLALQRHLAEAGVRLPVIVMTGHGDVPIAVEALKAGAADFLEKPFDDTQLLAAVSPRIAASQRIHDEAAAVAAIAARIATLTPREREVLQLWWQVCRTRRSPTTSAPARAPLKCIARGSWRRWPPAAWRNWCA